jgi:protein phosphatase
LSQGYGYRSEQRLRKENQDTFGVFQFNGFTLLVVCDGMGGHVGGAQASALAVRTIHDELSSSSPADLPAHLERAIEAANRAIYEEARRNYKLMGMGTTVVAAAIVGDTAHVAHVGDSRCYLLRDGEAKTVTRDHTMVNLFVDAELLSPEDAATHPEAHVLSRSLGVERQVDVDVGEPLQLRNDDRILLCSDGVHGVVDETALASIDWANPQRGTDVALEAVAIADGDDNATLVTFGLDISGESAAPTSPPDPDAIAEAVRASGGNNDVQPISAGPIGAADVGFDDVAPIEELDEVQPQVSLPPLKVPTVDPTRARREGYVKAAVALGCLAIIGGYIGSWMWRAAAPAKPKPPVAIEQPAQPDVAETEPEATPEPEDKPAVKLPTPKTPAVDREPLDPLDDEPVADVPPEQAAAAMATKAPEVETAEAVTATDDTDAEVDDDGTAMAEDIEPTEIATDVDPAAMADIPPTELPLRAGPQICVGCTSSYGPALVDIYLEDADAMSVASTFFAPEVPAAPKRLPHTAIRFNRPAPRGPEQAEAVRAGRDKDCRKTADVVTGAISRSLDYASLYRIAWLCFEDAHQAPLRNGEAADVEAFYGMLPHFQGEWAPPAADAAPDGGSIVAAMRYDAPAQGGIEYRLQMFEQDVRENGFQAVMLDLLGEGIVTDHLGLDILLEATAAAAFSRLDDPDQLAEAVWARRVYVAASAMEGPVGDLIRTERPDLATVIDTLVFESTGGDDGKLAMQGGELPPDTPHIVIEAYAKALGRPAPDAAPRPAAEEGEQVAQRTPTTNSGRPPARRPSTGGTSSSSRPRNTQSRPSTAAAAEPETTASASSDEQLYIKVYKRRPEVTVPRRTD